MDERTTRIECLKLAIQHYPDRQTEDVLKRAGEFETFVMGPVPSGSTTLHVPKKADNPTQRGR